MSSSPQCSAVLLEELMMEILSRVSVKDLMRFRCTSKWMNHLVLDRAFVKLHYQRSSKNTNTLLTIRGYENNKTMYWTASCSLQSLLQNPSSSTIDYYPHRFKIHNYSVLGVCNGLVCLQDSHRGDGFEEFWVRFWNPSTKLMSEDSPRLRFRSSYKYFFPFIFGLGYDDWSDTYQVVLLDNNSHKMEVSVYSLGDSCWRNILSCDALIMLSISGACVCGTVNWVALLRSDSGHPTINLNMNNLKIFSYDMKNEKYNYLPMPDVDGEGPPMIGVLKGCLCLSLQEGTRLVIWIMKEFRVGVAELWTPLVNINYEDLHSHVPHDMPIIPAVIFSISEDDNALVIGSYHTAKFHLYNKKDNRIDTYKLFNEINGIKVSCFSHDYVPSLVLPYRN